MLQNPECKRFRTVQNYNHVTTLNITFITNIITFDTNTQ